MLAVMLAVYPLPAAYGEGVVEPAQPDAIAASPADDALQVSDLDAPADEDAEGPVDSPGETPDSELPAEGTLPPGEVAGDDEPALDAGLGSEEAVDVEAGEDDALSEGTIAAEQAQPEPAEEAQPELAHENAAAPVTPAEPAVSESTETRQAQDGEQRVGDSAGAQRADDVAGTDPAAEAADAALVANVQLTSPTSGVSSPSTTSAKGSPASYKPTLKPVSGAISLLMIVVGFAGADGKGAVPYENSYNWGSTIFDSSDGVSTYYRDMSNGKFTFVPATESSAYGIGGNTNKADAANDGVIHVTLPEAHGNWEDEYYSDTKVAGAMLATFGRALAAADAFVDFASYDKDGNGKLDANELAIALIIAGYESALDSEGLPANSYSMWAHAWSYSDAGLKLPKLDDVKLDDYIAIAEKTRTGTGKRAKDAQEPLSVLIHELGHNLGLPDLYDTSLHGGKWSDYNVDSTSLMADGEWAGVTDSKGKDVYIPAALDAWSRYQLGWVKPTVVKKGGVYTISAQDSKNGYSVLLIPTKNKGEYYLIENRTFTGHDSGLANEYDEYSNGGLIIWHIDNGVVKRYLASNQVNATGHRPGVIPLYPENNSGLAYSLKFKSSQPETYYPFWTRSHFKQLFGSESFLDLPLYGTGRNANRPDARDLSGIRIEFLTDEGSEMSIRIIVPREDSDEKVIPAAAEVSVAAPAEGCIPATGDEFPYGAVLVMFASAIVAVYARGRVEAVHPRHARRFM